MSSQTPKASYQKPWQTHADQVARLVARGLEVPNPTFAEQFLSHVNHYRFSGYCIAFEQPRHLFPKGVTFDDVAHAYMFDTTLRDLLTEALEVLEIDVRSGIAHHFGKLHGAFGHTNSTNFHDSGKHADLMDHFREEADRSRELEAKIAAKEQVNELEQRRNEQKRNLYDAQDEVEQKKDALIDEIESRLKQRLSRQEVFTVRWTVP